VDAAVQAGLDAIAITDHNTTAAVEEVKYVAEKRGLLIFPGVEVSTAWGHVLAIFDPCAANAAVDGMLDSIGITPDAGGDGGRLAKCQMDEVFKAVSDAGGLAIAAHVDRWPTGVMHAGASAGDKVRLLSSEYLSAVEITIPGDRSLWNDGRIPNISTKLACIQSSDAHAPNEIGRRRVLITVNEASLDGMRDALCNYGTTVVFPD
jgi:PHP family Zn ribbon phosphoesterase